MKMKASPIKKSFEGIRECEFRLKPYEALDLFAISEKYQSGDALDNQVQTYLAKLIDIHRCDEDSSFKLSGESAQNRLLQAAGSAPGRAKINQRQALCFHLFKLPIGCYFFQIQIVFPPGICRLKNQISLALKINRFNYRATR